MAHLLICSQPMSTEAKKGQPELTTNAIIYYSCIILTDFLKRNPMCFWKRKQIYRKVP